MNAFLIALGKMFSVFSKMLGFGHGSTWPGHIALKVNKNFIRELKTKNLKLKTIFIAGTNGKTTTSKLIHTILKQNGSTVFQNESGANLLNGIASSLIQASNIFGKIDHNFAIFEIDENTLPLALTEITPDCVVLLNLFRDQLDRYGEVDTIARKWRNAIGILSNKTTLILNADDPQIAYLGKDYKGIVKYFGLEDKSAAIKAPQHAVDSIYCLNCGAKLKYDLTYFSHIGVWKCQNCGLKRPKPNISDFTNYPLPGVYNKYNTLAAILTTKTIGINDKTINSALQNFSPAFGRQEIIEVNGKKVQIFLSKNPTSFNQSLRTVSELKGKNLLIALNDRIPDGRDVSWIWDVDTEELKNIKNLTVSGDRTFDMALRIKYSGSSEFPISNFQFPIKSQTSNSKFQIEADLKKAITLALDKTLKNDVLYILPTYSAMLEVRKILTGKKIL